MKRRDFLFLNTTVFSGLISKNIILSIDFDNKIWNVLNPNSINEYALCGIEHRKIVNNLEEFIDKLKRCNVESITIGMLNGIGYSNYVSKFLPLNPEVKDESYINQLINLAHGASLKVIGWVPFNAQDLNAKNKNEYVWTRKFPEWRVVCLNDINQYYQGMCLASSPFKDWYVNIIKELLFFDLDSIWFDGFYLGGIPHPVSPGCVCNYCKDKFLKDTGHFIPEKIDWSNSSFKRWVRWRNHGLIETAKFYLSIIKEKKPNINVTFNCNTWPFPGSGWNSGVPLWHNRDFNVSQHAFVPQNEDENILRYKARLSRDLSSNMADIWKPIGNTGYTDGLLEKLLSFYLTGLSYGTVPWSGLNINNEKVLNIAKEGFEVIKTKEQHFYQTSLKHIAILISQNTYDFWGNLNPEYLNYYKETILGTWKIFTDNQFIFNFLFDNQIGESQILDSFKIIFIPNSVCLSNKVITVLRNWVKSGGVLFFSSATGYRDEWGVVKKNNPLIDDFLIKFDSEEDLIKNKNHNNILQKNIENGKMIYLDFDPGYLYKNSTEYQSNINKIIGLIKEQPSPIDISCDKSYTLNYYMVNENKLAIHIINNKLFGDKNGDNVMFIKMRINLPDFKNVELFENKFKKVFREGEWLTLPRIAKHDLLTFTK